MIRDMCSLVAFIAFLAFTETYAKYDTALAGVAVGYFFGRFCTSSKCSASLRSERRAQYLSDRRSSSSDSDDEPVTPRRRTLHQRLMAHPYIGFSVFLCMIAYPTYLLVIYLYWMSTEFTYVTLGMIATPVLIHKLSPHWREFTLPLSVREERQAEADKDAAFIAKARINNLIFNDSTDDILISDKAREEFVPTRLVGGADPPAEKKKKKRNRRKKNKKPATKKSKSTSVTSTYKGFTSVVTSPWRKLTFTLQVKATLDRWTTIGNEAVQKAIYDHLGFKPDGESYLEVKYHRVTARNNTPGSALALKIFNILSVPDTEYNAMRSIESYARDSTTYPQCSLSWDSVSRSQALNASENAALFSIFPHIQTEFTVLKFEVMYRHAQTPFADSLPFGLDHELAVLSIDSD